MTYNSELAGELVDAAGELGYLDAGRDTPAFDNPAILMAECCRLVAELGEHHPDMLEASRYEGAMLKAYRATYDYEVGIRTEEDRHGGWGEADTENKGWRA